MNESEQKVFFAIWGTYLVKVNNGSTHDQSRHFSKNEYITNELIESLGIYDVNTTFRNLNQLQLFKVDVVGNIYLKDKFFQIAENMKRDNPKESLIDQLTKFIPSVEFNLFKIF